MEVDGGEAEGADEAEGVDEAEVEAETNPVEEILPHDHEEVRNVESTGGIRRITD